MPAEPAAPAIRAQNLVRSFRIGGRTIEVLRGVSLEVGRGESLFVCGKSGAGKTTLLYTLAGLERPEAGTVEIEGHRLYDGPEGVRAAIRNRKVGFVFQSYCLLPELTALENVTLPARIARCADDRAGLRLLERVGLADRAAHLPAELSGGEQQRVALARALVNDPPVLFADEPTGNLDSKTGEAIMDLLLALARESNKTLIVVTHDSRLATRGSRRLEIHDGRLEEHGSPRGSHAA